MPTDFNTIIQEVQKKQDILTDRAVKAKEEYDHIKDYLKNDQFDESEHDIQDLKLQIQTLKQIFHESHFDDMVFFLSNPTQLLGMNFFMGLVRGIGFAIGFLIIFIICLYIMLSGFSPYAAKIFLHFFSLIR